MDLRDGSVWGIRTITVKEPNRLGWLNGVCLLVEEPSSGRCIGMEGKFDAEYVLTSEYWDISNDKVRFILSLRPVKTNQMLKDEKNI